jgi:hypothetical protein
MQLCVSNQHACVSIRLALRVVKKNKNNNKKKAKHGAGACRSKVYVYYDEFKVIFLMLLVGLELRISDLHVLRLMHYEICMSSVICKYEEKISIILKLDSDSDYLFPI